MPFFSGTQYISLLRQPRMHVIGSTRKKTPVCSFLFVFLTSVLHVIEKEHGDQKDYGTSFQSMITNVLRAENSITNSRPQATVWVIPAMCPKPLKRESV